MALEVNALKLWFYMFSRSDKNAYFCLNEANVITDMKTMSRATYYRAKKVLRDGGWIVEIGKRSTVGTWDTSEYTITCPEPCLTGETSHVSPMRHGTMSQKPCLTGDTHSRYKKGAVNTSSQKPVDKKESKEESIAPPTATLSDSAPEKNNPDELGVGEQEQVKSKVTEWQERSGSMDDIFTVGNLWTQYTQHPASYEVAAQLLLNEGTCELVTKYMTIILAKNPKTAKIAWTDMEFYWSKYDDIEDGSGKALFTGNRTKALTWLRSQEAKKATA